MKEEYLITNEQIKFIKKVMDKIDNGWLKYSYSTKRGLEGILSQGIYGSSQRIYLNSVREDYIKEFCI